MNCDRTVSLIMAAGYSRRFGSDKRVATLKNGKGLLESTVNQSKKIFKDTCVVLKEEDQLETLRLDPEALVIRVGEITKGLGDSLSSAFKTLISDVQFRGKEGALIWLGDMPWVKVTTCHEVMSVASRSSIVRPCYSGIPGHPIFFGRDLWKQLSEIKGLHGGKEVVDKNMNSCTDVCVSDRNIHRDVDFFSDLASE